jgi:hypothetical protein
MMRRIKILMLVTAFGAAAVTAAIGQDGPALQPTYSLAALKGKLVREIPSPEERLEITSAIEAGDVLRTGWRSSAQITSPEMSTNFHISPRTRVRLASDQPGVLLELQKGRLRAVFGKISEGPDAERIVITPSAILAVRGTEYGVAVSKAGDTSVVVFSGVVDVTDIGKSTPSVSIGAGQFCNIPRGEGPTHPMSHMMGPGDWNHGQMPGSMSGHGSDGMMGEHGSGHVHGGGTMGHGG